MNEAAGQFEVRYLEYQGVFFMMVSETGYEEIPYCGRCLTKMNFVTYDAPYLCHTCRRVTPFIVSQLPGVQRELNSLLREAQNPA